MSKLIKPGTAATIRKAFGGILGFISILSTASAASATSFTLDELNFHIEKCFAATTLTPASTRYCDKLLNNRIKPRKVEANALYNRGVIHFQLNNFELATADFKAALAIAPQLYQAHIALGEIAITQKDYNKALKHYDLVIVQSGTSKALNKKREGIKAKLEFATRTNEM